MKTSAIFSTDIQPPVFDSPCPRYVEHEAERGTTYAIVVIETPSATDNSGNVTVERCVFRSKVHVSPMNNSYVKGF